MPRRPWWLTDKVVSVTKTDDDNSLPDPVDVPQLIKPYCRGKVEGQLTSAASFDLHTAKAKVIGECMC